MACGPAQAANGLRLAWPHIATFSVCCLGTSLVARPWTASPQTAKAPGFVHPAAPPQTAPLRASAALQPSQRRQVADLHAAITALVPSHNAAHPLMTIFEDIGRLTAPEISSLMKNLPRLAGGVDTRMVEMCLFEHWASCDPAAAAEGLKLASFAGISSGYGPYLGTHDAVFSVWARQDWQAAWAALQGYASAPTPAAPAAHRHAVRALARENFPALAEHVLELERNNSPLLLDAARSLGEAASQTVDARLIGCYDQATTTALRKQLLIEMITGRFAFLTGPKLVHTEHEAVASRIQAWPDATQRQRYYAKFCENLLWAESVPHEQKVRYLQGVPSDSSYHHGLWRNFGDRWESKDKPGLEAWLATQPPGPIAKSVISHRTEGISSPVVPEL